MTTTAQEVQTTQVYQLFIRATPEQIWDGITQPQYIDRYYHGCRLEAPLQAGGRWVGRSPDLADALANAPERELLPRDGGFFKVPRVIG